MRRLLALAALLLAASATAEDGIVIQFQIFEQEKGSTSRSGYTNAVLMRLNEEVTLELDGLYVLKISANQMEASQASLLFTLKDLVDGRPYYIGAKSVSLKIGDRSEFSFDRNNTAYDISIDTAYGVLPEVED